MRYPAKTKWTASVSIIIIICLLSQVSVLPVGANDRAAQIVGSEPLLVQRLITPAGLSGKGQLIGLADSGLDKGSISDIHPDLQSEAGTLPKVAMLQSYTERGKADDPSGHGTFMAATIVGSGTASGGQYKGIAPGASLYFQALADTKGNLRIPSFISDIYTPAYQAGVRIHVNGWGGGSNNYDIAPEQVDSFVHSYPDFLPVFSAGNSGPNVGTLTSQANSKNALVVGSSQVPRPAWDPESRYADQVATSSSRGPTGDGRIKPELLAPGSTLISASSSLQESNFTGNSEYTRMGGSSMAAAVTGGALALLREQLATTFDMPNPSAALMRALLINGARSLPGDPSMQGFGILDSAGTALALRERTFKLRDETTRLKEDQGLEYKIVVDDESMPLKITLVWTDPPADVGAAAALVNNLDLAVFDPTGKVYLGNDFDQRGLVDQLNNVEQVALEKPRKGEYTIRIEAGKIGQGFGQTFALVYGQTLKTGIIKEVDNGNLRLVDGSLINIDNMGVQQVMDGAMVSSGTAQMKGSSIYISTDKAYIFSHTWQTGGIQVLPTPQGNLISEMNSTFRRGGYYVDPRAESADGNITVNGQPVSSVTQIPSGSELKATVNPVLQTLWKLEALNQEIVGHIGEINSSDRTIKLIGSGYNYKIAPWAAITYLDNLFDCSDQDLPFGTGQNNAIENLVPGTPIVMEVSPKGKVVQSIRLERPMICGKVVAVDNVSLRLTLDTGEAYSLYPGSIIYRDQTAVDLGKISSGDLIVAQMLNSSHTIMSMQAYSQVSYGRAVFSSAAQKSLYLIDSNNRSLKFKFDKNAEVYGGGIAIESNSIAPGSWVRVIAAPHGDTAWRVDLAKVAEEKTKTILSIDRLAKTLRMNDGSVYHYGDFARISRSGFSIAAEDLQPGERARVTTLEAMGSRTPLLVAIEVKEVSTTQAPVLRLTASALNGVLIIQGFTNGDRLYIYRKDGSRVRMVIANGQITGLYRLLENETDLRVLALDSGTGGMKSTDVKIDYFGNESKPAAFTDIYDHWAEQAIIALAQSGVVKGYGDGVFKPDRNISRAELAAMISRQQKLDSALEQDPQFFSDYYNLPWWALDSILAVKEAGLMETVGDSAFQPDRIVTRRELEMILTRLGMKDNQVRFPDVSAQPNQPVTRAQAAYALARLWQSKT